MIDENGEPQTRYYQLPLVDTLDLIGRTFLTEQGDGQKHGAQIVAAIESGDEEQALTLMDDHLKHVEEALTLQSPPGTSKASTR